MSSCCNTHLAVCVLLVYLLSAVISDCPKRKVLTDETGNIYLTVGDYALNTYCQWLIKGGPDKFVTIQFNSFLTECDYDYLYIYDGDSFTDPLIGAYSGATLPDDISASSGSVLVHFYSDLNYKPDQGNFHLTYTISACKTDCLACDAKQCVCTSGFTGVGCEIPQCTYSNDCGSGGSCVRDDFSGEKYCQCADGFAGRFCDLDLSSANSSQGQWTQLAPAGVGLEEKTGHSAVYDNSSNLWVYGGTSLAASSNQLMHFNLNTSRWYQQSVVSPWPQASYNHKAAEVGSCMYIAGGRNERGTLSQFWRFCFNTGIWTELADLPLALSDHTLTAVDDWLYVVGGVTPQHQLSASILRYDTTASEGALWEEVAVKSGRSLSVAGHSTIYHPDTRSLIIMGGHQTGNARFSKHSNGLYSFHVDTQHWTELSPTAPLSVAFHSANLVGNYMVIYGGQVARSRSTSCLNNDVYAYHLICHRWVDLDKMYTSLAVSEPSATRDSKGRHSHTSTLVNGNILLVVGGFRGNALADIWSYQVLSPISLNTNDGAFGTDVCTSHTKYEGCMVDPECIWCLSPPYSGCTSRSNSGNCPGYQDSTCPGLCAAVTDCQSCVVQSHNVTHPQHPSLRQHQPCAWCIHDSTCQPMSQLSGTCQQPPAQPEGWWTGGATYAESQSQCVGVENKPAGLRYGIYYSPVDHQLPDVVDSSSTSTVQWSTTNSGSANSRAQFYVHPNNITSSRIDLQLRVQNNEANITMEYKGVLLPLGEIAPVGVNTDSVQLEGASPTTPIFQNVSRGQRYLMSIDAWNQNDKLSSLMYSLYWNAISGSFQDITREFMEPFGGGVCTTYQSCLSCQLNVACGWCPLTNTCEARNNASLTSAQCGTSNPDHWLITDPGQCELCSHLTDCQPCADTGVCEWVLSKLSCQRLGLADNSSQAVSSVGSCPSTCEMRTNCSECLAEKDECIWCESSQTCEQFAPYLVTSSYGQCKEWRENHQENGTCTSCELQTNCSSCLSLSGCGWCGNDFNPTIGVCTSGDYGSSNTCSTLLHSHMNVTERILAMNLSLSLVNSSNIDDLSANASFSYAACPAVDECLLRLDVCHENATCEDTADSYNCNCNQGFEGDGKKFCNKTCFYECVHGTCGGPPDFECVCDLGWTNTTCDTDCGCNNHSTCVSGVGVCDVCQDLTYGDNCEFCIPTSYGNATIFPGCLPCECNGHGIASLDECDVNTGVCFCEEGFDGDNCELCGITSTGDPRDGKICYEYSHNRLLLLNVTGKHGVTSLGKYHEVTYSRWIISPFSDLDTPYSTSGVPLMTITVDTIRTMCPYGYVYVYDGIYTEDRFGYSTAVCGTIHTVDLSLDTVDIYTGYATIVYFGNSTLGELFTASYTVHDCPDSCQGSRSCDVSGNCSCIVGRGGVNCETAICPSNCSGHGYCNQETLSCFCDEGYGEDDCSRESYITINRLTDGAVVSPAPSPRKDYTVVDCGPEGSILFGGFSSVHGLLDDLWRFDGVSWHQISPNGSSPPGRYLHAAECVNDGATYQLIIHGGYVMSSDNQPITDAHIWVFYFDTLAWVKKVTKVKDLAGHTLTQIDDSTVIVVGGYSSTTDWNNMTFTFDFQRNVWTAVMTANGAVPAGLVMHTTVYHSNSKALYIHGGYRYYIDDQQSTNETFFYDLNSHRWYKRSDEYASHTAPRYSHSAVQLSDKLLIIGGLSSPGQQYEHSLSLYSYACDRWHNLGLLPTGMSGHASILNSSTIYIFGSSQRSFTVDVLTVPEDVCTLYSGSSSADCLSQRGCVACNLTHQFICFDKRLSPPSECGVSPQILSTGESCSASIATERNCNAHKDCAQCLTAWPYHGSSTQKCKWCSFCNVGKCIETGQSCAVENKCNRNQSEKRVAEACVEQRCRSATCDQCRTEIPELEGCIWTRQFMRSSEVGRQVSANPFNNWNCVTSRLISLSSITVWSAPPSKCRIPCQQYVTCSSCLSSDGGGAGGFAACYWSSSLNMCLPPATLSIMCDNGLCAPLLQSGNRQLCPAPCSTHTQCAHCLGQPECGWCTFGTGLDGRGQCMEGTRAGPTNGPCISVNSTANMTEVIEQPWNFLECPFENECNTSHHSCDLVKEDCVDLDVGHHCVCKQGYKLINEDCIPQCSQGCEHGECIRPDECVCEFSYVGHNCSIPCECNFHSNCAGPNATDVCLGCIDNTIGDQCEMCDKLAVGNATNGQSCERCSVVCSHHATVCVDNATLQALVIQPNQSVAAVYLDSVIHGPPEHKDVICLDCANNTKGPKCSECMEGYYRKSEDTTVACTKCQCNNHSFTCNNQTGAGCACQNNTQSSCQNKDNCDQQQCDTCRDLFVGSPVDGNQCYLRLIPDFSYCITRVQSLPLYNESVSCSRTAPPLPFGHATMLAALPKFLNVNIKIYINIEYGELDVYVGKTEDMFTVDWDTDSNSHKVTVDRKYDLSLSEFTRSRRKRSTGNNSYSVVTYPIDSDARSNYIRAIPTDGYYDSVFVMRSVKKRLVITLPEVHHDLQKDKFYIVLISRSPSNTSGKVFFRQDQIRIHLFVFFAVFFSCFFKFLSVCVIVWKIRSLYQLQQRRIQRAVELDQMASRPFGSLLVHFEDWTNPFSLDYAPSKNKKDEFQVNPACYEYTDDGVAAIGTVVFEMPGGKEAPVRAVFGSTLMTLRVSYPNRKVNTERHKDGQNIQRTTHA